MICDNCKNAHATLHIVKVVNGVKEEQHLCPKCAALQKDFVPFTMMDLFTPTTRQRKCGVCGMTPAYLKQMGKVGCANCYSDLQEDLLPILRRVHGRTNHSGRAPQQFDNGERECVARREALQKELQSAIEAENYEKAAVLRDELKQLRGAEQ